jgi:predicted dehydrogenase
MRPRHIQLAVIGCGHWGPNYLRTFAAFPTASVKYACDLDQGRLQNIAAQYPQIQVTTDFQKVLRDPEVQAVIICTPSTTHYRMTRLALLANKHVLTEKPLTLDSREAKMLRDLAKKRRRILMVGHVFLYNPGIRKIKQLIDSKALGKIYSISATRTHLGLIREDVNVIWDLAPHDISIFNYLLGSVPYYVEAVGVCHLKPKREDASSIHLVYPGEVLGHIHVSWADSNKERTVKVVGSRARVVFDDLDNMERVKIFKKGIGVKEDYRSFGEFQLSLRDGDILSPKLDLYEPLQEMCLDFMESIRHGSRPVSSADVGMNSVKVIEQAVRSMHRRRRKFL